MQHIGGAVHTVLAVDDVTVVVDQDEVRHAHVAERQAQRVDPEMIGELRIPYRDVAGHTFTKAEAAEDAQGASELLLAAPALLGHGRGRGQRLCTDGGDLLGGQRDAVDHGDRRDGGCGLGGGHEPRVGQPAADGNR